MNELISVIVPVYNCEEHLSDCLDSIIKQTHKNIEIILINDGSSDNSGKICDKYASIYNFIKVIHQENFGVSYARNIGLQNINGVYFSFVDSDDKLPEDALSIMYNSMKISSEIDMVIGEKTTVRKKKVTNTKNKKNMEITDKVHAIKRLLKFDENMSSAWGKLYRRSVLGTINFETGRKIMEDNYYVFLCLLASNKIVYINNSVYFYIIRESSVSQSKFSIEHYDIIYFVNKKRELLEIEYPELKEYVECMMCKSYSLLTIIMINSSYKNNKLEINKLVKEMRKNKKGITHLNKLAQILIKCICISPYIYIFLDFVYRRFSFFSTIRDKLCEKRYD